MQSYFDTRIVHAYPNGLPGALVLIAAAAGAIAVVLWLGWIAVTAANATLGRYEYPNGPPYDLRDAWIETGVP